MKGITIGANQPTSRNGAKCLYHSSAHRGVRDCSTQPTFLTASLCQRAYSNRERRKKTATVFRTYSRGQPLHTGVIRLRKLDHPRIRKPLVIFKSHPHRLVV